MANGSPMRWKYTLPPLIGQIYQLALHFFGVKDQVRPEHILFKVVLCTVV